MVGGKSKHYGGIIQLALWFKMEESSSNLVKENSSEAR